MVDGVAGFVSAGFVEVDVAVVTVVAVVVVAGVAGVAGMVATGVDGLLTLPLVLLALLVAASPQAIPRALRPRTADNTNTFVILIRLLSISKLFNPVSRVRLMKHNRFCRELFLFPGKRENRNTRSFCQPKITKKITFFHIFFYILPADFGSLAQCPCSLSGAKKC